MSQYAGCLLNAAGKIGHLPWHLYHQPVLLGSGSYQGARGFFAAENAESLRRIQDTGALQVGLSTFNPISVFSASSAAPR